MKTTTLARIRTGLTGLVFFANGMLWAHHGAEGGGSEMVSSGTQVMGNPHSFLSIQEDWVKGSRPEPSEPVTVGTRSVTPFSPPRNLFITTFLVEHAFTDAFSLNLSAPLIRYDQKGAEDYTRVSNVFMGFRTAPLLWFKDNQKGVDEDEAFLKGKKQIPASRFFFTVDGRIGFPSGSDARVSTQTDFWQGAAGLSAGYISKTFRLIARAEGQWPLSKLERTEEPSSYEKLTALLNGQVITEEPSNFRLKKTAVWSGYGYYFPIPELGFFSGVLYQDPFPGIVVDIRRTYPRIYREAQAGISIQPRERLLIACAYHYPWERGGDRKKNEETYTINVTQFF